MIYDITFPEEPDGPLWDQDGNKFEKIRDDRWRTRGPGGTWEYSYWSMLQQCGPLTDTKDGQQA